MMATPSVGSVFEEYCCPSLCAYNRTEKKNQPFFYVNRFTNCGKRCIRMCLTMSTDTYMASVAQLDAPSDWRPGGRGFNPRRSRQHSFVEIDHEIFSEVILSLPLIQEVQLSVSGERMCTILVNRLED